MLFYKKRLNNNAVVVADENGNEQILTGKGLGFNAKIGAVVDKSKIEKIFTLKNNTDNQRLQELLKTVPVEYLELAEEIINYARIHIDNEINASAIIALCDHIYMAAERKKQGIDVKNLMLWDIKKFYRDEYGVGVYAVELVKRRFQVELTEDEAGFIALHIVNAQLDLHAKSVNEITQLMQEIETIVRLTFSLSLDVNSVYYYRFITHLKFFTERLLSGKTYENQDVAGMLELVQSKYPQANKCVEKIAQFLRKKYGYTLSDEEVLYLSIHISRIAQISK